MAFHYKSDGSYVGGLPAFLGGLVGIAICFGLHSIGLNFFLSLVLGAAIPFGFMARINYTPQNYCDDIVGKWICDDNSIKHSENEPIYSWEFKDNGTMIWDSGRTRVQKTYQIKGRKIVIEGEKQYKVESLFKEAVLTIVDSDNKKRFQLKYWGRS